MGYGYGTDDPAGEDYIVADGPREDAADRAAVDEDRATDDYCADCGHNHTGPCADDATSGVIPTYHSDTLGRRVTIPED